MNKKIYSIIFSFTLLTLLSNSYQLMGYQKKLNGIFSDTLFNLNTQGYYYEAERGPIIYNLYNGNNNSIIDTADTYCNFIFFYKDGTMFIYPTTVKHFDSIQSVIDEKYFIKHNKMTYRNIGRWGYYRISGNIIQALVFRHDPNSFHPLIPENLQINIKKANTISLLQATCERCKNLCSDYNGESKILYKPPKEFHFIPFTNKPDSSIAGFKNKRWYKKTVVY